MGRRVDIDNDDDEQQSTSSTSSSRMAHESQVNIDRHSDDEKFDHDPLIHDTILPHRKRIRRDTLLSIQQQQQQHVQFQSLNSSTTSSNIKDVSRFLTIVLSFSI
jgi:hypothetical protein